MRSSAKLDSIAAALLASVVCGAAHAQEEGRAKPETPVDAPIWTVDGCAGLLAQVFDERTGMPIAGAKIELLPRTSEAAGRDGAISEPGAAPRSPDLIRLGRTSAEGTLVVPPPGAAVLVVSMPGYATSEVETPCTDAVTTLAVELVAISPAQSVEASAGGDAHRRLGGEALETMAGAPRNVFQAVQTVPGVARPTLGGAVLGSILGSGDLGVRGSRPGESRTYLDGIEIPYFYHYLGLSSVIPAEMIEMVDFVPGGAGPQFGRLTGGVLDIHSRALRNDEGPEPGAYGDGWGSGGNAPGNRAPWHGRANLTFFEANAIARGPLGKGYFSISDRFSIWDLVYRANENGWGNGAPVWGYNDLQAVYKRPTAPGSELSVIGFGTFDHVAFVGRPTKLHTEFYRAGVSWRTRAERGTLRLSGSWGYDRFLMRIVEPGQGLRMASHRSQHDTRIAADGELRIARGVAARAGVEAHGVRPEAGLSLDWEQQEWFIVDRTYRDRGAWAATWAELELRPHDRVVLLPGVRWDYDTFVRRGWVDPRMTVRWFADDMTTLSASGGLYHRPQPFSLAFADERTLGLAEAEQVSAGVERRFVARSGASLVGDVRIFRNVFRDQVQGIEFIPDFDEYGNSVTGDGTSHGTELFARFSTANGRTRGEAGYSFSRTEWRNVQTEGAWTASDLDSTHAFTLVVNRDLRRQWTAGMRARWYSGLPFTNYGGDVFIPDDGGYIGVGENPFGKRAPSFFQLDVRFAKHWRLGNRMGMEAFLDVQNVTARSNVDRSSAEEAGGDKPTQPVTNTAMPFFPSLGASLTF